VVPPCLCCAACPVQGRKLQTTAAPGGACGAAVNARCFSGQCCFQYNYCGVTSDHCSSMCQPLYSAENSACRGAAPPVTPPSVTPPLTGGITTAVPGGACGAAANARCSSGQCCSQYGYCGVTAGHCDSTCQSLYSATSSACRGTTTGEAPPLPPLAAPIVLPPAQPPVQPPADGTVRSSFGVSYHAFESVSIPAVPAIGAGAQTLIGTHPGYNINSLYVS
jgi:hypothetical protein